MKFYYSFPAVKGLQAGKEYYITMVPLNMLKKLFPKDNEYVLPEYRAQRKLNESRIPEIRDYMLNNINTYVFSALAASIDGEYKFISDSNGDTGILEVSMDARFLINDGQHRKAAILAAINENPSFENETISVVLYEDLGLERSQQMFTDLNKHAVKTSNSLAELYDSRDPLAVSTRRIAFQIPFFDEYMDKEKDNLGKFSSSLFTLNNLYTANKRILRKNKCDDTFEKFAFNYWMSVAEHMLPWIDVKKRNISKMELREQYIAVQAVILQALGRVGGALYENKDNYDLDETMSKLEDINWKRNAEEWKLRVIKPNGRMINNERAIILAANVIKGVIGLELTSDEQKAEDEIGLY